MMRLQTYAALSVCATVAIIYHAFHSRGQFYPAMVYLSTSKISLVLLLNMGLVIKCSLWQLTKKVFLGSLREAEVERLNEQSWREVMEVLFAITIFRQDFSVSFLAMVTTLLLIKALHWLAQKRVEYIETTPTVPTLSHVRIVSFMAFLLVIDSLFLYSSVKYLIETKQASVSLFFSFEYMILATTTVATFVKYLFYVRDMILEGQWEKKAVYTFYLELIRDLLHLSMYLCFFMVIFVNYGVPLHLIRELYETFRNFKIRVADYIRYRKITSNMNDRFPDATSEELSGSDATCIICREEMTTAKKLLCGHLFHVQCLRSWLERQHTCPTCRALVVPPENGSTTVMGPHGPLPHSHHPASTGTSAQSSTANQSADVNLSRSEARLLAATRAASMYEKSFVYPSGNKLVWSTGYSLLRHGQFSDNINKDSDGEQGSTQLTGPLLGGQAGLTISVSPPQFPQSAFPPFQVIGATMSSGVASSHEMTDSELEGQTKFLEHQIEILKNQLQSLQKPKRNNNAPVDTQLISSDEKGKGSATDADCGHHGEIKRSSS